MLSIGEFSKICEVTTKTLRYYDEVGLIKPASVNPENGYRYYEVGQLKTMLLINKLKGYCFSLEEIEEVLGDGSGEILYRSIQRKRAMIQEKMKDYEYTLNLLEKDILNLENGVDMMAYVDQIEVRLVETQPMNILFSRQKMSVDDFGLYIGKVFEVIAKEKLTVLGAPMFIYHDIEFDPQANDTEIAVPVQEVVKGTRNFPGGLCAKSVHKGPYSELTSVYAKLEAWMEKEGYAMNGAPYEVYLNDPNTNIQPTELLTEVYCPVRKK